MIQLEITLTNVIVPRDSLVQTVKRVRKSRINANDIRSMRLGPRAQLSEKLWLCCWILIRSFRFNGEIKTHPAMLM